MIKALRCSCLLCLVITSMVLTSTAHLAQATSPTDNEKPNVILILADDIGVETIGAYGSEYKTPNIDSLAHQGVRIDNAHATPICTPSRVRLLTGKYSFRNYKGFAYLDPSEYGIGHMMKDAGYTTMVAGKWQLAGNSFNAINGTRPKQAGFDEHIVWYIEPALKGSRYWQPTFIENGERKTFCRNDFRSRYS